MCMKAIQQSEVHGGVTGEEALLLGLTAASLKLPQLGYASQVKHREYDVPVSWPEEVGARQLSRETNRQLGILEYSRKGILLVL